IAKFGKAVKIEEKEIRDGMPADEIDQLNGLADRVCGINSRRRSYRRIQAAYDVGPVPHSYLFRRGNFDAPGPEVEPGFLTVLSQPGAQIMHAQVPMAGTSGRRLALAHWLTDASTPAGGLVARVMVNRIWMHLFGAGIVPTSENFGRAGLKPSNQE